MKRIFVTAFLLASFFTYAQNSSLLNGNFWKNKPTLELVKAEIEKGNSPAAANGGNHDVVSMAINSGAPIEVIKYLIDQPGNALDKTTHDGRLYIHWAANKGNVELLEYLISKGSSITRTDDKGNTPLTFAASNGQTDIEVYKTFFKAGIDPKTVYKNGVTLLHYVIGADKDLKVSEFLLTKGLKYTDLDELGRSTFDYAARSGNTEILKALLAKGVKPTGAALIFAAQGSRFATNNLETYKYLVENVKLKPASLGEDGENVLHYLVKKKDQKEIIEYFFSKKVDPNATDKFGNNALMMAAASPVVENVNLVLAKTKKIDATNVKGETALYAAVSNGSPEVVQLLLDKGAKTNVIAKDGNLAYALVQSYKPARPGETNTDFAIKLEILKKAGVNFATPQKDGSSLYHAAVAKNDLNLLKTLEGLQIDINAKDKDGMTPLHKAALVSKNDLVLKYLIQQGAKKDILTDLDETAFDLASDNELLIKQNVNIDFLK